MKMSRKNLLDVIEGVAKPVIQDIIQDGHAKPGHNGLYHDPETPVRNTAHWMVSFSRLYEITGNPQYLETLEKGAEYLLNPIHRPDDFTIVSRNAPPKDRCNGLIGQAWVIEGLMAAYQILKKDDYLKLAINLFRLHPFDAGIGLWRIVEIDGKVLFFDPTFNHQLWFAWAGTLLADYDDEIRSQVHIFLDCINDNLTVQPDGLIYHPIEGLGRIRQKELPLKKKVKLLIKKMLKLTPAGQDTEEIIIKSIGYHAFNTLAYRMIKSGIPDHTFWNSSKYHSIQNYMLKESYQEALEGNIYGYPYNPPGFEIPVSLSAEELREAGIEPIAFYKHWIQQQFNHTYSVAENRFCRNNEDPNTLTARLYEVLRLSNDVLKEITVNIEA